MKFEDVLEIKNGRNQKAVENLNGRYPIYGSGGLMGYADDYICDSQTVVIGRKGSINNPLFVDEPFWNVDTAFGLCANRSILLPRYLYYFCKNFDFERLNKTVTIPSLTKSDLLKIDITLPDLEEQSHIVTLLDKVSGLIVSRKKQLQKLDELVKARFVELFGDPISNPMGWKVADFKEVVYFQEGPGVRNWQFRDSGIKLINIRNLIDDKLVLENTSNYLSEQEVAEKYQHFLLNVGDYVMASSGVTWGKIAEIYEEHLPLCLNTSIIRLRPYDENVISKKYLFHYIKGDAFRTQIDRLITGSAQPNFGPTHLKQISILVPPIELQEQFATFVEQTDKSKFVVQNSLGTLLGFDKQFYIRTL